MDFLLPQFSDEMQQIVADTLPSLVQVHSGRSWQEGSGAGTIWHSEGLILTNAHVIARGAVRVTLDNGETLAAKVLAYDDQLDLAAISIEASGLPTIQLGDSRHLKAGHWVIALGHPWGVKQAATTGIIIGTENGWPELPARGKEWIVMDMKLRPGNSGGPLLDAAGSLIGINTAISGPQVGIAVPIHIVKAFLKQHLSSESAA
jgi:S1-C subfamily serine protease